MSSCGRLYSVGLTDSINYVEHTFLPLPEHTGHRNYATANRRRALLVYQPVRNNDEGSVLMCVLAGYIPVFIRLIIIIGFSGGRTFFGDSFRIGTNALLAQLVRYSAVKLGRKGLFKHLASDLAGRLI